MRPRELALRIALPRLGLLAAASLSLSCGGGEPATAPPVVVPGEVIVALDGALPDDGAVLLEVGSAATAVLAERGDVLVHARQGAAGHTVAVFGPLSGGPILRVPVANIASLPTFRLREVAAQNGSLRSNLATYRLQVAEIR